MDGIENTVYYKSLWHHEFSPKRKGHSTKCLHKKNNLEKPHTDNLMTHLKAIENQEEILPQESREEKKKINLRAEFNEIQTNNSKNQYNEKEGIFLRKNLQTWWFLD